MKKLKLFAIFLTAILIPIISAAESDNNFDYYNVELIVFLHKDANYRGEQWQHINFANESNKYNIKVNINGKKEIKIKNDDVHPSKVVEKKLIKEYEKLSASQNYQPILHIALNTPINYGDIIDLFIKQESPLNIADDDIDNPSFNFPYLQGAIHINRLRYFHVNANIDVNLPLTLTRNNEKIISFEDLQKKYNKDFNDYIVKTFHINDDRKKIRSNELHYLDNPVVGILIKFNREA